MTTVKFRSACPSGHAICAHRVHASTLVSLGVHTHADMLVARTVFACLGICYMLLLPVDLNRLPVPLCLTLALPRQRWRRIRPKAHIRYPHAVPACHTGIQPDMEVVGWLAGCSAPLPLPPTEGTDSSRRARSRRVRGLLPRASDGVGGSCRVG